MKELIASLASIASVTYSIFSSRLRQANSSLVKNLNWWGDIRHMLPTAQTVVMSLHRYMGCAVANPKAIEVTEEMEIAGLMELLEYDPEQGGATDVVRRIFLAMLSAKRKADQSSCGGQQSDGQ